MWQLAEFRTKLSHQSPKVFSFPFQDSLSLGYHISQFFDSNVGVQNAIASTRILFSALFCDDASTIEGKDEEESSDEPVGVGVYSFSKVETDADDDANDDDDGK